MDGLIVATILAGIFLVLMGIFKLGSLIKFIPNTITVGFTAGIAVTILIGQIKDFLGITYAQGIKPIETIEKIEANIEFASTFSIKAAIVGAVCLAILIIYPKIEKKVPPSLIAVFAGALMVKFIPGMDEGVYTIGELYTIPSGFPKFTLFNANFSFDKISAVLPDAFTIAILAAIESLLSCVVADTMVNSKHNPNAELVAQGIGNISSVMFGGIPATGAIARTAANAKNGGRTPIAGMVHAVVLLMVLLFLMPYAGLIPMPTIAAILFMVAYNMSEWRTFKQLLKNPKSDITVLIITFILTVIFDLTIAIEVGLVIACLLFMRRMAETTQVSVITDEIDPTAESDVEIHEEHLIVPEGVEVYEINGPYFFGVANRFEEVMQNMGDRPKVRIVRMRKVPFIDSTGIHNLTNFCEICQREGIQIILSGVNEKVHKVLQKSHFYDLLGKENICSNINEALEKAKATVENGQK